MTDIMTPLRILQTVTASRPPTGCQRLTDVRNIGPESAIEAAGQVARWLALPGIANRLTDPHLRTAALDMLQTEKPRKAEDFLRGLVK